MFTFCDARTFAETARFHARFRDSRLTPDRTAAFPRTQRSSIGRRLDDLAVEAVERALEAVYAPASGKAGPLRTLNLIYEKLRDFWRLAHRRMWITQQQLYFIVGKVDEAGKMTGAWLKSLDR